MVNKQEHLQKDGFIKILKIVETMNRKKSKQELIRILTHYT